jgi:hypothetical protein
MEIFFMYGKLSPLLLLIALLLSSCKFSCNVNEGSKPAGKTVSGPAMVNGALVSNSIDVAATGVKLKSATLQFEDGTRVPDDNVVKLNQKINLLLQLDNTWKMIDGKSFIGASEKITTSSGYEMLNAADLFKDYSVSGVDPTDAKYIRLNAVITKADPSVSYYKVEFRVWDKKGDGEIKGSYQFYIQSE